MTVSNKEEKPHSIRNETFQSGTTLSESSAAWSLFLLLCKSERYTVTSRSIHYRWSSPHGWWSFTSSGLSVKPNSQSPAMDIVLFCLFIEYQAWEGPKIPSKPMLPHFLEAVQWVQRRPMKMYMGVKAQPRVKTSYSLQPSTWCW